MLQHLAAQAASLFSSPWIFIGFFGQFVFFMRFAVQWFASERSKRVVIPMAFWYLSIGGSLIILVYSIHIKDIVFITAQSFSLFVYIRNIMLQHRIDQEAKTTASVTNEPPATGSNRTEG